mgnify:CR=1 FL=1
MQNQGGYIHYQIWQKEIDEAIAAGVPEVSYNNCHKKYYTYYKTSDVGRMDGDEISNRFTVADNTCALTLDIASIASGIILSDADENKVRDIGSLEDSFYVREGSFRNSQDELIAYRLSAVFYDESRYFVMLQTSQFIFAADIQNGAVTETVYDMIILLRSCSVDVKTLLIDYASDTLVDQPTNIITLFRKVLPESGYVVDYLEDWREDTTFIIIDTSEDSEWDGEIEDEGGDEEGELDEGLE